MVITPTHAVRHEVIDRFRIHPDRVVAIHLAAPDWFRPAALPKGAPYFLYAGTIERRKNIGVLIDAWRELSRTQPVELWLAGRIRDGFEIRAEPGLRLIGLVEDERLPELYSGAVACLYPSLYEGFGLPVLEAMQCGAMVIASRDPAITEVAANAARQADARDPGAWLGAMRAALDHEIRCSCQKQSINRAAQFSWERTARLTREVYEEARRRF
jgi:glycosyltransferase involved in cell wall biosynthesis